MQKNSKTQNAIHTFLSQTTLLTSHDQKEVIQLIVMVFLFQQMISACDDVANASITANLYHWYWHRSGGGFLQSLENAMLRYWEDYCSGLFALLAAQQSQCATDVQYTSAHCLCMIMPHTFIAVNRLWNFAAGWLLSHLLTATARHVS